MSRQSLEPDQTELQRLTTDHDPSSIADTQRQRIDQPERSRQLRQIHWKNPALLGISLLAGIILALIHHFFYRYWNGKAVQSDVQQRWIIRAGTAFAFCFRASLAVGTSVAFVQYLWLCLQSRPHKIRHLDSMFAVLSSAAQFLNFKLWAQLPILLLIALVTWLLPIAAIIAPGTLIVTTVPQTTFLSQIVPQLDLRNKPDTFGLFEAISSTTVFFDPTSDVIRLSLASASSKSILQITPPQPNSSYSLDFRGPTLSCRPAADSELESFQKQLDNFTAGESAVNYFSWTPDTDHPNIDDPIPFDITYFQPYDDRESNNTSPTLFMWAGADNATYLHTGALIGCSLSSVTYTVDYRFEDTQQTLDIKRGDDLAKYIVGGFNSSDPELGAKYNATVPYQAIMSAFGRIMVGSVSVGFTSAAVAAEAVPLSTLVQSTGLNSLLYSADNATLAHAVEEMFQNITFSLMSDPLFLVDSSDANVSPTNVTVTNPQNIYTYQPFDLVLSYSIAIFAAVMCAAIGFLAMMTNGLSYTNNFSTILRTTRGEDLDKLVAGGEVNGADPLPAFIAGMELRYRPFTSAGLAGFQRR